LDGISYSINFREGGNLIPSITIVTKFTKFPVFTGNI